MHPTLVLPKKASTASVDFSTHNHLPEGPAVLPPVGLPYVLPQPSDLGHPSLALRKEVMAGLFLPSPASPVKVILRLADLVL